MHVSHQPRIFRFICNILCNYIFASECSLISITSLWVKVFICILKTVFTHAVLPLYCSHCKCFGRPNTLSVPFHDFSYFKYFPAQQKSSGSGRVRRRMQNWSKHVNASKRCVKTFGLSFQCYCFAVFI